MNEKERQESLKRVQEAMLRSLTAVQSKKVKDKEDKKEESAAARRAEAEIQGIIEANEDLKANRELRFKYARWVYFYLVGYSSIVALILIAAGFNLYCFALPDEVLSYLVGSTAVSAIGLVLAVTTGLFNKK